MDINDIKALLSPNRPGGVSALELEKALRLINELDECARQAVAGCVEIARRERSRALAAEAECERLRDVCRMALGVVDPAADPVDPMALWDALEDALNSDQDAAGG